jgi:hypothetical protein
VPGPDLKDSAYLKRVTGLSLYPGIMAALKPWAQKFEGGLPHPAA